MAAVPCFLKLRMVRTPSLPLRPASFPENSNRCLCLDRSSYWRSSRSSSGLTRPASSVLRAAPTSSANCQPTEESLRRKDLQLEDTLKTMAYFRAMLILQVISGILVGIVWYLLMQMTPKGRGSMKLWYLWMVGDKQLRDLVSLASGAALLTSMVLMVGLAVCLTHLVKKLMRHLQKTS